MKWVGSLLSWLVSASSWLLDFFRWCGQPIELARGWLVLAALLVTVMGCLVGSTPSEVMPKSLPEVGTWPATGGSIEKEQAAEADSVRKKAEVFISVITDHVANADSAEQVRQQLQTAVDRMPADQLQHVIDSLFAKPNVGTGAPPLPGAAPGSTDRVPGPAGDR